jgi:hypothetical protein
MKVFPKCLGRLGISQHRYVLFFDATRVEERSERSRIKAMALQRCLIDRLTRDDGLFPN